MTSSDWRSRLGRGARAVVRLFSPGPEPQQAPAEPHQAADEALEQYQHRIAAGQPAGRAAIAAARECLAGTGGAEVVRLGYRLLRDPDTQEAGRAVLGMAHLTAATPAQAWAQFEQLTDPDLRGAACPEYAIAGFGAEPDACSARCADLVSGHPGALDGYAALVVARHAFSVGQEALARRTADVAGTGGFGELTDYWASEFTRLRSWFSDGLRRQPQPLAEADLRFGVLDYKQPDNASRNVGDYIQTLASLGHLVRQDRLRFTGEESLVIAVEELRKSVKAARRITGPPATVQLLELQRDGNVYQDLPLPTWAIMFGWYLHPTFSGGYNLPFHANLRPLFISFHLNKPDALTPAAIDYLRHWGPIGCRDWQTVALLAAADVPAFFSGCITSTVDTLFARTGSDERAGIAYVDAQDAPEEDEQIEQSVGDIRSLPLTRNLALGREWVGRYHSEFAEVVTTRLHSYLPARSVGCRVQFNPRNPSDPRFGGLIAIDDAAYEQIRHGILDKLAIMLEALAQGANDQNAYQRWQDLCAPDVAFAEEFLGGLGFGNVLLPAIQLPELGDRVVVVHASRPSRPLARLLKSLTVHSAGVPVLVVGLAESDNSTGPKKADEVPSSVHWVPGTEGQGLTVAAVLDALPDGTRALVLSADTVLRANPAAMFAARVSSSGLAAEADVRRFRQNLSGLIRRVSARQGEDWRQALRFAAAAHRRCGHGGNLPDPRVCVIDPAALRAAGWTELAGELIVTFGARWGEALALVTRGDFTGLPEHSLTRLALEPYDAGAVVLQGAGAARIPLAWL